MEALKILGELHKSTDYKEWQKQNSDSYLAHVFTMVEHGKEIEWQVGYYDELKDAMATFTVRLGKIEAKPHEDIVKDGSTIRKLELGKVKIDLKEALDILKEFRLKNYSAEIPDKTIVLLQHLEIGIVWNITFITKSFNTINIKLAADTGQILEHKKNPIFYFKG